MKIRFSDHARQRLMDRCGIELSKAEELAISRALGADIEPDEHGTAFYDATLKHRGLKVKLIVKLPEGVVTTILAGHHPTKRWRHKVSKQLCRERSRWRQETTGLNPWAREKWREAYESPDA